MFSFIGFCWDVRDPGATESARELTHRLRDTPESWSDAFSAPGMQVFCKDIRPHSLEPHRLCNEAGVILGAVFERHRDPFDATPCRHARWGEDESRKLVETQGRRLLSAYWGQYVAFLRDRSRPVQWVLHDPTSTLPCFQTRFGPVSLFFSHLPDLQSLNLPSWEINEDALRRRAVVSMFDASNLLKNVERVYGGQCVELHAASTPTRQFYWNPLTIAGTDVIDDEDGAIRALHASVKSSVQTWASCHDSIVLRASGGLDSSIVAGCLRETPSRPRINCFTIYVPATETETTLPWSRKIAKFLGVEPREYQRNSRANWARLLTTPAMPQPECDLGSLELSLAEQEFANECGATAFFTGDGGDELFGAGAARFAAREYLRLRGLSRGLWKVAEDVALMRDLTVWSVLRDALHTRRHGEPNELVQASHLRTLVRRDVLDTYQNADIIPHPWYEVPKAQRPWSMIMRMGTLSQITPLFDPRSSPAKMTAQYVLPFYSQPSAEVCLRTPLYLTISRGRGRVIARKAFTNEVPAEILNRYWKDHPTGHLEGMITANLPWIRELLLDGVLSRVGIIDKPALENQLGVGAVKTKVFVGEVFNLVCDEAWARHFVSA